MSDPIKDLRDALGEASNALGWASSMLIEGVEFYTVREVLHAAQKDAMKCHQALTRAESALRELEAEPRYTVEAVLEAAFREGFRGLNPDKSGNLLLHPLAVTAIKRRLAERGEK